LASPLEQFAIFEIVPISFGNLNLSITNSSLFILLSVFLILRVLHKTHFKPLLIPTRWQAFIESFYEFVVDLIQQQIGTRGLVFFPLLFTLFTFLLLGNLLGIIPFSFTFTSHLIATFGLSVPLFIGVTLVGLQQHGLHFFSFFLPAGAPLALAPFLVVLEIISYCFRAISLGVRLFANMIAGHTLVKIISGFAVLMVSAGGITSIVATIPITLVVLISGLEMAVAFIQAYVFAILICIYLNDALNLH